MAKIISEWCAGASVTSIGLVGATQSTHNVPNDDSVFATHTVVDKFREITATNIDGGASLWVTADGTTPEALADGSRFVPATAGASLDFPVGIANSVTVKVLAVGTGASVCVEGR